MYEELLGYDIRLCPEDYLEAIWKTDVRELFLLKTDIDWPITVDNRLWPTFFRYIDESVVAAPPIGETLYVEDMEFRHEKLWLWPDLTDMVEYFNNDSSTKRGIAIAVCLYSKDNPIESGYLGYVLRSGPKSRKIPNDWIFLGFDIADEGCGRISGLVNCGYTQEDKDLLSSNWTPRLNEFGLFDNLDDAFGYKTITDERVPEHAPFYVYGIYRAPDILISGS